MSYTRMTSKRIWELFQKHVKVTGPSGCCVFTEGCFGVNGVNQFAIAILKEAGLEVTNGVNEVE